MSTTTRLALQAALDRMQAEGVLDDEDRRAAHRAYWAERRERRQARREAPADYAEAFVDYLDEEG